MKKFKLLAVFLGIIYALTACTWSGTKSSSSSISPEYASLLPDLYVGVGDSGKWFYDQYGISVVTTQERAFIDENAEPEKTMQILDEIYGLLYIESIFDPLKDKNICVYTIAGFEDSRIEIDNTGKVIAMYNVGDLLPVQINKLAAGEEVEEAIIPIVKPWLDITDYEYEIISQYAGNEEGFGKYLVAGYNEQNGIRTDSFGVMVSDTGEITDFWVNSIALEEDELDVDLVMAEQLLGWKLQDTFRTDLSSLESYHSNWEEPRLVCYDGTFCLQYEVAIRYSLAMNGETMSRSDVVYVLIPLRVLE